MNLHSRIGYETQKAPFAAPVFHAAGALALGLAFSVLTGCGATTGGEAGDEPVGGADLTDEDVRTVQQKVQSSLGGTHVFLDVLNKKQQVSGVIFLPWASDNSTWASCGVTFVSPHFAITAAHCVPKDKAPIDTIAFWVMNYNIDELAVRVILGGDAALADKFNASQQVTGTFPNYTKGATLTEADGYRQMEVSTTWFPVCKARVRCAEQFGTENCPAALRNMDGGVGVDIALIECEFRDPSRPWTRVFSGSDSAGVAIESHWSHEYLNLSVQKNDGIGPLNNFVTYGAYAGSDTDKFNNYHYRGLVSNQFMPLISSAFPNGTTYKTTSDLTGAKGSGTTERYTDMFGCHGTSGSGVFPQNSDMLLGPTIHGAPNLLGRLCVDPTKMGPGVKSLSFVRPAFTRQIEALSLVQNDR
jgi:hypothetical protein